MDILDIMKRKEPYCAGYEVMPTDMLDRARDLCQEYNRTSSKEKEKRQELLKNLLGDWNPQVFIEPDFHCDYGFNIHMAGFVFINYNCVILDTSPVHIGKNVFIAPGVCLACASHPIDAQQRAEGIEINKPITISDDVWLGANVTVCGGVTIGPRSIIGAGSVVTRDIPADVVAVGNPCRVLRKVTERDKVEVTVKSESLLKG